MSCSLLWPTVEGIVFIHKNAKLLLNRKEALILPPLIPAAFTDVTMLFYVTRATTVHYSMCK